MILSIRLKLNGLYFDIIFHLKWVLAQGKNYLVDLGHLIFPWEQVKIGILALKITDEYQKPILLSKLKAVSRFTKNRLIENKLEVSVQLMIYEI